MCDLQDGGGGPLDPELQNLHSTGQGFLAVALESVLELTL
ncbi:hypothetical protein LEMLEM_LOCUS1367 [Lemmus lemmus]